MATLDYNEMLYVLYYI